MDKKEKERRLIFELIRFRDYNEHKIMELLEKSLDYPWVLGQLMWNRVGGVAYYVLLKCNALGAVNREFRNSLKNCYEMNVVKSNSFKTALYSLGEIFSETKFPYAFLKGAYLNTILYPEGLRTSNDFDILVSQSNLTECADLFRKNGFIQGYYKNNEGIVPATRKDILDSRMNRGEVVPFLKPSQNTGMDVIEIDINFSLDFKAKQERDLVGELLAHKQFFTIRDQKLSTLSQPDFLIQLCVHLFKEATIYNWVEMGRDLSLYKFCDIYAFILKFGDNKFFSLLEEKIHLYGLEKECYYALKNTKEIYPSIEDKTGCIKLLENIKPRNEEFLSQIFRPALHKTYSYNMSFTDWLFSYNKESYLTEMKE